MDKKDQIGEILGCTRQFMCKNTYQHIFGVLYNDLFLLFQHLSFCEKVTSLRVISPHNIRTIIGGLP